MKPAWLQSQKARLGLTIVKLVFVPVIFGLVIQQGLKSAPDFPSRFGILHMLAAALIYQGALLVQSSRLSVLVKCFGAELNILKAQRINLLAHLYLFVLMTGVAMEGVRFYLLRRAIGNITASDSAMVLILDRLVGAIASAIILGLSTLALTSRFHQAHHLSLVILSGLAGLMAVGLCLLLVPAIRTYCLKMTGLLLQGGPRVLVALIQSVVGNLIMVSGVSAIAHSLQMSVDFGQILWAAMAGQILMLIPISVFGVGAAEVGGVALLSAVGASPTEAIVVVFLIYLMRASAGLVGLALELWESRLAFFDRR